MLATARLLAGETACPTRITSPLPNALYLSDSGYPITGVTRPAPLSRRTDPGGEVWANGPKVPEVPREDDLGRHFDGAMQDERMICLTSKSVMPA